jgi:uncharacterized protein (TIGR02246 family)
MTRTPDTTRTTARSGAGSPEALHAVLAEAINRGDLDTYANVYDVDAVLVVPPHGRSVHGRKDIRADAAAMLARRPHMTIEVRRTVHTDGLALTRTRWTLVLADPDGDRTEMTGSAAVVWRRRPDGTWAIVLDDTMG